MLAVALVPAIITGLQVFASLLVDVRILIVRFIWLASYPIVFILLAHANCPPEFEHFR
jgi:hypothetical protein